MTHRSEADIVANVHNTARFFTEHRQVAMILLIAVFLGMVWLPEDAQAQGPRHPGAGRSGAVPVAGRDGRAGRATGHASHGAGGRAEHDHPPSQSIELRHSLDQLSRPVGRLHPARRQRKGQIEKSSATSTSR